MARTLADLADALPLIALGLLILFGVYGVLAFLWWWCWCWR